jgi:hypothetical protein
MTSHIEMSRVANDAAAVRAIASGLLASARRDFTDWELDFLEHMAVWAGREPLSQRQREKLLELRDDARTYRTVDGISVARLVQQCHEARADLDDDDGSFVADLRTSCTSGLKRRALLRLLRCARRLGLVESYVDLEQSRA